MITRRFEDRSISWFDWIRNNSLLLASIFWMVGWGIRTEVSARLDEKDLANYKEETNFRIEINERKIREIDERGSRSIPLLERRLTEHEARFDVQLKKIEYLYTQIGIVPPIVQVQIDQVKDQQRRLVEALDNTYNLLQQHLRDPGAHINNIPLKKTPD